MRSELDPELLSNLKEQVVEVLKQSRTISVIQMLNHPLLGEGGLKVVIKILATRLITALVAPLENLAKLLESNIQPMVLISSFMLPFLSFFQVCVTQTGSEGTSGPSCSCASSSVALSACRKRVKIVTVKFNEFPNYSMLYL